MLFFQWSCCSATDADDVASNSNPRRQAILHSIMLGGALLLLPVIPQSHMETDGHGKSDGPNSSF